MGEQKVSLIIFIVLFLLSIIGLILPIGLVNAATIHGSVYNVILEKESDIKLEIDTLPKQFIISKDGDYSFNVPNGTYIIKAYTTDGYAEENISVFDDGDYIIDIVLAPIISEVIDNDLLDTNDISNEDITTVGNNYFPILIGIILLFALSIMTFLFLVSRQKASGASKDDNNRDANDSANDSANDTAPSKSVDDNKFMDKNMHLALAFIKNNERTTQKDLRKQIPLSEAKISLIVAELEHEGKIKKIRKGRGNILVYVKD